MGKDQIKFVIKDYGTYKEVIAYTDRDGTIMSTKAENYLYALMLIVDTLNSEVRFETEVP